jgi:hypothetical protein
VRLLRLPCCQGFLFLTIFKTHSQLLLHLPDLFAAASINVWHRACMYNTMCCRCLCCATHIQLFQLHAEEPVTTLSLHTACHRGQCCGVASSLGSYMWAQSPYLA